MKLLNLLSALLFTAEVTCATTSSKKPQPTSAANSKKVEASGAQSQVEAKGGGKCYKSNRPPPPPPPPPPQPAFNGVQHGIGSWYIANAASDSTNGHSWCGYPYNDYSNGFAPDLAQMQPSGKSYESAASTFCGLEAIVTDPSTGNQKTMYIIDAFDHRWVRTPGSIDIMKGAWSQLHNQPATDKNVVIYNVTWSLTGKKSSQYCFKCAGG